MPSGTQANIFTCTFCFHLSNGPPHVIGRSARLACSPCHAALLDLAICWVCGELIFRGDECVSFGWCFWHRACYGCLLYGSRAICRGETAEEGVKDSGCGGREVTEAPLCAACVVEAEVNDVREESVVVKRGLRRVERVDGGLTRRRWEAKGDEKNSAHEASQKTGRDGADSEGNKANNMSINLADPSESVIWVDIFDPINGPSFKPSPLKPIPLFMQRAPNHAVKLQSQQPSALDIYIQTPPHLRKPASAPSSVYPPVSPAQSSELASKDASQLAASLPVGPTSRSPTPSRKQAFTLVKEEPLKRPSSRLASPRRRSDINSSGYCTPPEYPDQVMRTPYPLPLSTIRAASPLPSQLTSHMQRITHAAPQSSEYLERYQPLTAPVRTAEGRRLRRIPASLSEEGSVRGRSEQRSSDVGDWGRVGAELKRFFTGR
ncbi:hypothetical protein LCI18_000923 [Fusarium solani-melongenae]|uniref:Uncharacterized protein n=1 Tax=Fusarium solani subsp. cucurbitae TaxID=2747967 RepID=A0ACD3YQ63_FUSSC|nr:hypothetical protein LCI18_000923 [Fusarium solani-melongenae]